LAVIHFAKSAAPLAGDSHGFGAAFFKTGLIDQKTTVGLAADELVSLIGSLINYSIFILAGVG